MSELGDAIANAVLFAGDAKTDSKGLIRIDATPHGVTLESYDDYLYIYQNVQMLPEAEGIFYIDKKVLKEAGEDGFVELLKSEPQADSRGVAEIFAALRADLFQFPEALLGKFTFPSDRFGKISRIKGDEPTKITLGEDQGMRLAKFVKGNVVGMMAFLEEENDDTAIEPIPV